jgi:septal ring factor EnvC (AmiA/AmiB activator)|tara:strand:+ start:92 stop:382 length:291 start_codon:yes stop_codon:yes gene_type:complete
MGIKHDPTTGLPSNDNSSYEELLQMWREEKQKRKTAEDTVNRLVEENNNYETISKSHKEINGKLQTRVSELEEDNKKLSKQIEDKDKHIKQLVDVM